MSARDRLAACLLAAAVLTAAPAAQAQQRQNALTWGFVRLCEKGDFAHLIEELKTHQPRK